MANLHRLLLAAALTLVASLAVASSASAAPGNGADVVRQNECFNDRGGTFCIDAKYVQNETQTPSGNVSYHANGELARTFTGEGRLQGCNSSNSQKFNYHFLAKDGEWHEFGSHQTTEYSFDCFGDGYPAEDCTFSDDVHYANGRLQFDRPKINCNP